MIESIKKELVIEAPQAVAFKVFTEKMDLWWPSTHHVGSTPMTEMILEPRPDGKWYSKHEDGTEVNVGYVLKWDPNEQLILAWQINGDFKYVPDLITEVEVNFIIEGEENTRIKLEHRNLDLLAGGAKVIEDMDEGWGYIMNLYKDTVLAENEV